MYMYYKNSGIRKFCPNRKFSDKSWSGLTRAHCKINVNEKKRKDSKAKKIYLTVKKY